MPPTNRDQNPCAIAIETSTRHGSITFGHPPHISPPPHTHHHTPHPAPHTDTDTIIATATLPQQRRHNVDLMPTIAQLCEQHNITRHDITEIYVSIGPGSFTGLRIAIATAKMLAMTLGTKIVAVPTINVIAHQIPSPTHTTPSHPNPDTHLAIAMSLKHDNLYSAIYQWQHNIGWRTNDAPKLRTIAQLLADAPPPPHPLAIVTPHPPTTPTPILPSPDGDTAHLPDSVTILDSALAHPTSTSVYAIGRAMARRGDYSDPHQLTPLYVRRAEAEELWDARQNAKNSPKTTQTTQTP